MTLTLLALLPAGIATWLLGYQAGRHSVTVDQVQLPRKILTTIQPTEHP